MSHFIIIISVLSQQSAQHPGSSVISDQREEAAETTERHRETSLGAEAAGAGAGKHDG